MRWLTTWRRRDRRPEAPLMVTDENREQVQRQYPGVCVWRDKRCPVCGSYFVSWRVTGWRRDAEGRRIAHYIGREVICPFCRKLTVDDPWVPDNDNPPMEAVLNHVDWLRCPHSGGLFSLHDGPAWAGDRHRKCGQRIVPIRVADKPS